MNFLRLMLKYLWFAEQKKRREQLMKILPFFFVLSALMLSQIYMFGAKKGGR